ncbi:MAG: PP2C family protein-serine/threonine phosphatase [Vulcanimicrobiota bacterium]
MIQKLWNVMDELVGRAVRRELTRAASRRLRQVLLALSVSGMMLAYLRPGTAVVALIFPLLLLSFFEDTRLGLLLSPLCILIYSHGPVGAPEIAMFVAFCLFSVAISGVTSHKYRQVFIENHRCSSRLETARQVQQAMEPAPNLTLGPLRVHTRFDVCQDLGGDFVGVRELGDGSALILIGDVQGKGPQSALTAAFVEGIFHHCCEVGVWQPHDILSHIHKLLPGKGVGRFVTALCLRSCPQGRCFQMVNAGHPLPIVFGRKPRTEGLAGLVLGLEGMFCLESSHFELAADERILLLSDGCYEEEGVTPDLASLLKSSKVGVSDVLSWLDDRVDPDRPDDRTVVLVEPNGLITTS